MAPLSAEYHFCLPPQDIRTLTQMEFCKRSHTRRTIRTDLESERAICRNRPRMSCRLPGTRRKWPRRREIISRSCRSLIGRIRMFCRTRSCRRTSASPTSSRTATAKPNWRREKWRCVGHADISIEVCAKLKERGSKMGKKSRALLQRTKDLQHCDCWEIFC